VLDTIGSVLGIGAALAGVVGILFGAKQKSAIEVYKTDNDALRGLNSTLKAINDEQTSKIEIMKAGLTILRETVTSAPQITELSNKLAHQNAEVLKELSNVARSNSRVSDSLTKLMSLMEKANNGKGIDI